MKKPFGSKRRLREILASSCCPDCLEFMFNESRFVRTLPTLERELFQDGVCGNEALHLETKNTYNHTTMHPAVLNMKTEHLQTRKLLAHNTASAGAFGRMQQSGRPNDKRVLEFIMPLIEVLTWRKWCDKSPSLEISIKKAIHCLTMCFILPCAKRRE